MRISIRILLAIIIILFSMRSILAKTADDFCPSLEMVKNLKITEANERYKEWQLLTEKFEYKSLTWQVVLEIKAKLLPEAKTKKQAIEQGQIFYQTKAHLHEPTIFLGGICDYGTEDGYYVWGVQE